MNKKTTIILLTALIITSLFTYYFISINPINDGLKGTSVQSNNNILRYGDVIGIKSNKFNNYLSARGSEYKADVNLMDNLADYEYWKIIKLDDRNATGPVRYRDKVLLYSVRWGNYLSARGSGDREDVKLVSDPKSFEEWIIIYDNNWASTKEVVQNEVAVFQSVRWNNLLSGTGYGSNVDTMLMKNSGEWEKWLIHNKDYYKNWMANTTEIHNKYLREITFPASHDAGAHEFTWELAAERETEQLRNRLNEAEAFIDGLKNVNIKGYDISVSNSVRTKLKDELRFLYFDASWPMAKTTDYKIYDQLTNGIRWFDFRIYLKEDGAYIHHALTGKDLNSMLTTIRDFLASTKGEIIVVEMSHFVGDIKNFDKFEQEVLSKLGDYAYRKEFDSKGDVVNNPLQKRYNEVVGNEPLSKAILLMDGPVEKDVTMNPVFWKYSQLNLKTSDYDYSNTTSRNYMISNQSAKFKKAKEAKDSFTLWYTLTASTDDVVTIVTNRIKDGLTSKAASLLLSDVPDILKKNVFYDLEKELKKEFRKKIDSAFPTGSPDYNSIRGLSDRINPDCKAVLESNFQSFSEDYNAINVLYADSFSNIDLVDMAINYSKLPSRDK